MDNTFRNTIIEDLKVCKVNIPASISFFQLFKRVCYSVIYFPGFACVFLFRVNHCLDKKNAFLSKLMNVWRFYLFKNDISCRAKIGHGLRIVHVVDIVIPAEAVLGKNCVILNGVSIGSKGVGQTEVPVLGDNVYIGSGSKIIGGISVGNNVTIGALTLCNKSIPDNSVAYGNPAMIKPLKNNENKINYGYSSKY